MKPSFCGGHDLIFLVYPPLDKEQSDKSKTDFSERVWQLESLFTKAGLLK